LKKYLIAGAFLVVIVVMVYAVRHYGEVLPDFWNNFIPGVLANITGVTIGAIVGIPVGFAINHYAATVAERRHHDRKVTEVRQLLEQVRLELNLHNATYPRLTQSFMNTKMGTALPAAEVSMLLLGTTFGRQLIGNRSVIDIGETLTLFEVSGYYGRVEELNRLLALRMQDTQHPENWDAQIANMANFVSFARNQADYEIQQAVERLTGRGRVNG